MDLFTNLIDSLNEHLPQPSIEVIDNIRTYIEKWGTDGRLIITSSDPKEVHAFLYNMQDFQDADFISWHCKITNVAKVKDAVAVITEMRDGAVQDGAKVIKFAI